MIKKLVRYGNSNALVIDRAILELLGIGEGSFVKLSTDGKALTITPDTQVVAKPLTTTDMAENMGLEMAGRVMDSMKPLYDAMANDPMKMQQVTEAMELMGNQAFTDGVKEITRKYASEQVKLLAPEPRGASDALLAKYKDNYTAPEFLVEMADITKQYAPELIKMEEEINAFKASFLQKQQLSAGKVIIDEVK